MLGDAEEANRRRPFEFLSNIFKRRREQDDVGPDMKPPEIQFGETEYFNETWINQDVEEYQRTNTPRASYSSPTIARTSTPSPVRSSIMIATATVGIPIIGSSPTPSEVTSSPSFMTPYTNGQSSFSSPGLSTSLCPSPIILHQTPIKSRDIGEDMEAIRLSRQDNPYLQKVAGSQTSLAEEDFLETGPLVQEEDTAHLVSQCRMQQDAVLSISEVHEHLIRSPPPTTLPKTLNGKGIFLFPVISNETEGQAQAGNERLLSSSGRTPALNPLVTKGHEDVLDQHLRQVLDTQRKMPNSKGDVITFSVSMPGSPAKLPSQSLPLQSRKCSHSRTLSEETSTTVSSTGAITASGYANDSGGGVLAPVFPPGKKHPYPNEVLLTRPLLATSSTSSPNFTTPPLMPLTSTRSGQTKRSQSTKGSDALPSITSIGPSSSTSLSLPIKSPNQPKTQKYS